jgi:hypothetical protein
MAIAERFESVEQDDVEVAGQAAMLKSVVEKEDLAGITA